ncbi:signal peptidase II [Blochmannia endosymbiont of Polyrhachis (Hedomyrma) turneri]|uniref:signal peptidase II n=1 Tax=Blochmannia endosymbiont of Polyrhachis (Hedomyrma) turneri TaxID=1505596 RepID=UPI00061A5825|nr:signal peptidase II [Blochmannia endosymbiont of Polyrhachis (Hedomyrma) turneri]AKC59703.1 Lipoprotein signal peptidase [Blochmannia endosymbiont of Polyrhachis (Hedomyrma) turneri]
MNAQLIYFSNLKWLFLSLVIMFFDLMTKFLVMNNCVYGKPIFIFSCVNCYYVHNFGVAFSLLSHIGIKYNALLSCIIILIILVLVFMLCCLDINSSYFFKIGYSVIIGGALGNVFNRIYYGVVIDFIDFHIGYWHWPTFNVADLGIFVGVVCIILSNKV